MVILKSARMNNMNHMRIRFILSLNKIYRKILNSDTSIVPTPVDAVELHKYSFNWFLLMEGLIKLHKYIFNRF